MHRILILSILLILTFPLSSQYNKTVFVPGMPTPLDFFSGKYSGVADIEPDASIIVENSIDYNNADVLLSFYNVYNISTNRKSITRLIVSEVSNGNILDVRDLSMAAGPGGNYPSIDNEFSISELELLNLDNKQLIGFTGTISVTVNNINKQMIGTIDLNSFAITYKYLNTSVTTFGIGLTYSRFHDKLIAVGYVKDGQNDIIISEYDYNINIISSSYKYDVNFLPTDIMIDPMDVDNVIVSGILFDNTSECGSTSTSVPACLRFDFVNNSIVEFKKYGLEKMIGFALRGNNLLHGGVEFVYSTLLENYFATGVVLSYNAAGYTAFKHVILQIDQNLDLLDVHEINLITDSDIILTDANFHKLNDDKIAISYLINERNQNNHFPQGRAVGNIILDENNLYVSSISSNFYDDKNFVENPYPSYASTTDGTDIYYSVGNFSFYKNRKMLMPGDNQNYVFHFKGNTSNYFCGLDIPVEYESLCFETLDMGSEFDHVSIGELQNLGITLLQQGVSVLDCSLPNPMNGEIVKMLSTEKLDNVKKFVLFPNPSDGHFRLEFKDLNSRINLSIRNMIGQVVYNEDITVNNTLTKNVDLSNLDKGIYFVSIENGVNREVQKVIIK